MKNKMPLVSIVIPCYNHEKYVEEALNSVLLDDYQNKELIIINDGSSDNSGIGIKNWVRRNENKIKVEYTDRANKGLCATLNELIGKANGKYIVVLASDDALFGNTIAERVQILENAEKQKMVLVSDAKVVDSDGNIIMDSSMENYNRGNKQKYYSDKEIAEEVILNPSISGATMIANKDVYKIIGRYPEDLHAEDWFFYQRAAAIKSVLFWDKPVSLYRVHNLNSSGNGISLQQRKKLIKSVIKTFRRNLFFFKETYARILVIKQLIKYNLILIKIRAKEIANAK